MIYLLMIPLAILGGVFYRFRGGWPDIPRPLEQMAFCSIFAFMLIIAGLPYIHAFVAYSLAVVATLKGHGNNMDLGHAPDSDDEWYEFLIKGYEGKLGTYWYEVLGLCISGLSSTGAVGLALSFYSPFYGLIVGLSGALKAVAYMIGWALHPKYDNGRIKFSIGKFTVKSATEWGEFLFGFGVWAVAGYTLINII